MFSKRKSTLVSLVVAAAILSAGCFKSKTVVSRVDSTKPLDKIDGVHYMLPRTVVKAAVAFKRTEEKPGEFERFTPCFFTESVAANRLREKSLAYSVEDPTFSNGSEPDPAEHFVVSVKGGFFEKKSLLLDYVPGGVVIGKATAESSNEALDFTLKAAKAATSIVTGIIRIPGAGGAESSELLDEKLRKNLNAEDAAAADCFSKKARIAAAARDDAKKKFDEASPGKEKEDAKKAHETAQAYADKADAEEKKVSEHLTKKAVEEGDRQERERKQREDAEKNTDTTDPEAEANPFEVGTAERAPAPRRPRRRSSTRLRRSPTAHTPSTPALERAAAPAAEDAAAPETDEEKKNRAEAEALIDQYKQAAKIFNDVRELEQRRAILVSGGNALTNLTPETLDAMLKRLDATIEERKGFFFGTTTEKPWTANFEFRPDKYKDTQTSKPLIWFAEDFGLCPTPESVEQGINIPKKFKAKKNDDKKFAGCPDSPAQSPAGMEVVYLYLDKNLEDQPFRNTIALAQLRYEELKQKRGWYYRIPAKALVSLKVGTLKAEQRAEVGGASLAVRLPGDDSVPVALAGAREVGRARLDVAQLGVTVSAPASGSGRTNQTEIQYDDLGALKNFKYASDALLKQSNIEDAQATGQTIIDARTKSNEAKKAAADARAAAADPLTKMKVELETLQTQNKINEEKKKLGQSDDDEDEDDNP